MQNQRLNDQIQEDEEEKMSDSEKSDEDDDNNVFDVQQHPLTDQRRQHHQQKMINDTSNSVTVKVNHLIILKSEIPFEAKRVINLIVAVKILIKYVKLVNINQALEDKSSPRLAQCTIVRWLSMSNCLEALLKSF
ncbi:unnamed protein product [Rotaria sordida]|uniref:Uncharacterized protein n=1 Tax=Rotaria sordida TaxID=392033 RepID=A0A815FXJ1_9BILA|nr:unnamed protein product [Rotaria sordida]